MSSSGNFTFLAEHSPLLAELGATAERLFPFDPASCVLKLRLLAEALTQDMAARVGVQLVQPSQAELFRAVDNRLGLDAQVRQLFHLLRRTGNAAAHEAAHGIGFREGLEALKVARELAVWYHRSFGRNPGFKPGPFVLPDDPSQKLVQLHGRKWLLVEPPEAFEDIVVRLLREPASDTSGGHREEGELFKNLGL